MTLDFKVEDVYPKSPLGEKEEGIPSGRDVEWQPLVDYRRHGVSENTIHGAIAWFHGDQPVHSFGGNVLCYGRSMMKPFYIKLFAKELAETTDWRQKAVSVASHNGSAEHIAVSQSLLSEGEWGLMQTPLDVPLVQFGRQVRRPRRWFNNSSGHHAAILKGCRLKGWNRAGYTLPSHKVFIAYRELMKQYLGEAWSPRRIARDGDGLPTVSMTVNELARCYAALARERDTDWIWEAMVRHPDLVGGFNRLDTTVMKSCEGKVIAKEGADGLLGLAINHPDYPEGLGVVIKIASGWNPRATWYVARGILGVLGFEMRNPYPLRRQKAFLVPGIVPESLLPALEQIPTWDEWDADHDRWYYDADEHQRNGVFFG
ncbi:asparaginase [Acanthopleuribacter pedis]|uniref:Asparaginase n=1 Tax=Acanthopleuribacter pedis TaxID=442870 RepID=A0A8J7QKQ6_9BACT|nr:asparaginase [Acanthopleuribacter pedis]MBO1319795.1 asparaginase [Acanthopleuribacter pedis]